VSIGSQQGRQGVGEDAMGIADDDSHPVSSFLAMLPGCRA
jgi:hypothetical protein